MVVRQAPAIEQICVREDVSVAEVLARQEQAAQHGLPAGIVLVVDAGGRLLGTVTDGDVRRGLLRHGALDQRAGDICARTPISFPDHLTFREIQERLPVELRARGRRAKYFLAKIVLVDERGAPTRVLDYHQLWEQRVATHRHVVVVGLGYVGLTLALAMVESGYTVTGVDTDRERVDTLCRKQCYVHEVGLAELVREHQGRTLFASTEMPSDGDVFIIAVGTPVQRGAAPNEVPQPSLVALEAAARQVARRLAPGGLVVLRSTVPVGATRGVVLPILEQVSGLRAGRDFHLAFAPERTAEGQAIAELRSLPQLVGGVNADSTEAAAAVFRDLTSSIVRMPSCEAAELAKLLNNCFRDAIFAFANQAAQVAAAFNLDVVEVIRAANRGYPRDPVPLPSPGVGGPCLTKDPYIFAAVARGAGIDNSISLLGRAINESMHELVARDVVDELRRLGKDPAQACVLVCGLAFKGRPETGDLRESSALAIALTLRSQVGRVLAHDPVIPAAELVAEGLEAAELPQAFGQADAVLLLNNHRVYEKLDPYSLARALRPPGIVYDAWHLLRAEDVIQAAPCVYMGLGFRRRSAELKVA